MELLIFTPEMKRMRRREFIGALGGTTAFWPLVGTAQHRKVLSTGVLNAPSGPPPYPLLLADVTQGGYTTIRSRPPWYVAGVDYNVGPQSAPAKTIPANGAPPGCSIDAAHPGWISVDQDNITKMVTISRLAVPRQVVIA